METKKMSKNSFFRAKILRRNIYKLPITYIITIFNKYFIRKKNLNTPKSMYNH